MTNNEVAMWWLILGLITFAFGTYRVWSGRTDKPDDFTALCWVFLPMIFLPVMILKAIFLKKKK